MNERNGSVPNAQPCEWHDEAPVLALGLLNGAELDRFRAHLDARCSSCEAVVERIRERLAELDLESARDAAHRPDPARRAELLERVRERTGEPAPDGQPWKGWSSSAAAESAIVRGAGGSWQPTRHSGIEVKPLSVDAERDAVTMLVRMAPGSSYPAHRHGGREECFILSGELDVGGEAMVEGDYQVMAAGSVHPVQSTSEGCLLLIVSSQHDEFV